eukprot:scaffold74156_cov51-Phaeocystis_antarctica.AAC.1
MGPVLRPQGCTGFRNRARGSSMLLDPEHCGMWYEEELAWLRARAQTSPPFRAFLSEGVASRSLRPPEARRQ